MVLLNTSSIPTFLDILWMDETMTINSKTYRIGNFHRSDLTYSVFEPYNKKLEEDILANGLKFPLIAIKNTKENWEEAAGHLKAKVNYNPYADFLVVYGNQRLRIIDEVEMEFGIPVIVADSHVDAIIIFNTLKYRE